MSHKKISIITVNFNDKEGLIKTFESIKNQTWQDFEYIVVDGNSSDGSKDIIEQYKNQITYAVSEPDSGIYNAMNKGIRASTGDYVFFLNAGDFLYSDSTLDGIQKSLNSNLDLYYGNAIFKDKDQDVITEYPDQLTFYFFTYNCICHQSCFIKRTLFNDIFFYNEELKIVSDWEFLIYGLAIKNISYKHINCIVSYYDFSGISSRPESEATKLEERLIVMKKYFPLFIEDYKVMEELNSKRIRNILHIKKFPIAWKILKGFANSIFLFLPKQKKQT